ncbi:MAG: disulfide bond formation protein B [Immundisolibacter sp.]|uniref:disulfide bond formation protein B n=1 Tax=Immundisolibacter sp. TaxID=1934948 RepID=UPI003EDF0DA5
MPTLTPRQWCGLAAAACAGLLGFGYYLEFAHGLEPCPLCILQRLAFMAVGTSFLAGALIGRRKVGTRVLALLALLFAGLGGGVAGRQVWLQSLPADAVPACGPGLDYMIGNFPLLKTLSMVLRGSGECAENTWQFLGLGIAAWALLWFALLGLLALRLLLRPSDGT